MRWLGAIGIGIFGIAFYVGSGGSLWLVISHVIALSLGISFGGVLSIVGHNRTLGDDTAKRERMRNEQEQYLQMVRDLRADDRNSRM